MKLLIKSLRPFLLYTLVYTTILGWPYSGHLSVRGWSVLYFCSFWIYIFKKKPLKYSLGVSLTLMSFCFLKVSWNSWISSTFLIEICLVLSSTFHFPHDQLDLVHLDPKWKESALAQFTNTVYNNLANVINTIQIYNNSLNH